VGCKRIPPPRANGPPIEASSICDDPFTPGVDDYLIDPDHTTLKLSTGYPVDLSRRSSKNEDGNLPLKKSNRGQSGELCPNLPKSSIPTQKIKVDRKNRFRYQVG